MQENNKIDANCSGTIRKILYDLLEFEYKNYLINNKKLLINGNNIKEVLLNIYDINIKRIKTEVRNGIKNNDQLKNLQDITIENLIFEIFSNKDDNINIIKEEIKIVQNYNLNKIILPIIDESLNLNISIYESFVKINKVNTKNVDNYNDIYDIISKYEYIYSIDDILLEEIDNEKKIESIKSLIKDKKEIKLELYHIVK
tara:strand:- start:16056 stop:16655 length:600 start_codon:yes stop_codon:yes gene_type:complete